MGAGAVHGQKKAERPGTASPLEVNHIADIDKMVYAPALPSRTLIRRPGFLFWQGALLRHNICHLFQKLQKLLFGVVFPLTGLNSLAQFVQRVKNHLLDFFLFKHDCHHLPHIP